MALLIDVINVFVTFMIVRAFLKFFHHIDGYVVLESFRHPWLHLAVSPSKVLVLVY